MKIGIIFTGGTIGSCIDGKSIGTSPDAPRELLLRYRRATGDLTEFDTYEPYTILSEGLKFSHITRLVKTIRDIEGKYDGLIVTHGTDTLQYTAAALSYILGLASIPTVLVSSNYILSDSRANGLDNFLAAVEFLRQHKGASGVYVSYRNTGEDTLIYRGTRLLAHHALADEIYAVGSPLAKFQDGVIERITEYTELSDACAPFSAEDFIKSDARVQFFKAHPGMIYPSLNENTAAVLIETYHSGTLRTAGEELTLFAEAARRLGIPLFLAGITGGVPYKSADVYEKLGLISLPRISPIALYMKLCLCVSTGVDPRVVLPLPLGGDTEA